jgi:hypothetical protein
LNTFIPYRCKTKKELRGREQEGGKKLYKGREERGMQRNLGRKRIRKEDVSKSFRTESITK